MPGKVCLVAERVDNRGIADRTTFVFAFVQTASARPVTFSAGNTVDVPASFMGGRQACALLERWRLEPAIRSSCHRDRPRVACALFADTA